MEAALFYFGKVILCSGVMFLYYQLSLKDKTFHHYNRFYLLSAMLIPLLLPLIHVDDFTIEVNNEVYMLIDKLQNFNTTQNISNDHTYFRIIFSALGLVSLYFIGKLTYGIFRIRQLKSQFQKESFDGINFYQTNLTEAPFSYFKNLFWKNSIVLNSDIGKQILQHEMVHIEQKHSFDKIFIEIITAVFWFNPFFHIIKKEINLIHEYLADKKAVKQSDTKAFAQMLLASHFSGTQLPATSPFLSSNLKKRLKMLQKPKTKFGYARRIFALPVLFSIAFAYMVNAKNKEIKDTNIAIKEAVSKIKRDTLKPGSIDNAIQPVTGEKSNSQEKIADLGKKIEEKSNALKKLNPDSEEFKKNVDEIGTLSAEIGKIASSNDFRMMYKGEAMDMKKMNDFFKSDEWKDNINELKDLNIEIPEIPEIPEFNIEFPENPPAPPKAPNAPKAPKIRIYKTKDYTYQNWSPEDEKEARKARKEGEKARKRGEIARLEGEKARIAGEQARIAGAKGRIEGEKARKEGEIARIAGEQARIAGEQARKEARIIMRDAKVNSVYVYNSSIKAPSAKDQTTMFMNADFIKKDGNGNITMNGVKNFKFNGDDDTKIYVDGKKVTKEELNALNMKDIASININKQEGANIRRGEIRIQTKK
ncbi:M56 family metallopeptidase [Chryseobacterium sp. SIMBA_029]|uniref:M56 family metallopeptidase n=1 Tax=Chryseobacterium sp. SIMBA_029 TaxID=3085772 RepID=UPI00397AD09C